MDVNKIQAEINKQHENKSFPNNCFHWDENSEKPVLQKQPKPRDSTTSELKQTGS